MRPLLVRLGLSFGTRDEEDRFVGGFVPHDLWRTRVAMLLGGFVYYIFTIWDRVLDPVAAGATHWIRVVVLLAVLLPITAATLLPRARAHLEALLLAYSVTPTVVLCVIYAMLDTGFDHGGAGIVIVVLFVSALLPMRTVSFALFCAIAWIAFDVCERHAGTAKPGMAFVNDFTIGIAMALALYAVAVRELRARAQFRTVAELSEAKHRTDAALVELQGARADLIQAEKLAALGQLVAGVAHEINTPIGLALTTSTTLEVEVRRVAAALEAGQVRRSELARSVERLGEGMSLLFNNLTRAGDLVYSFKQVAVDQVGGERRSFDMRAWLLELLRSLGPALRKRGHRIETECPDGIVLDGYPGALGQVLSNLVLNAVTHAYPADRAGLMRLDVAQTTPDRVRIVFVDDGRGIAPEHVGRVFDPFFTTRRGLGSTGLGLHIVYNLVTATLNGRIAMESEPGAGTRFTIDLPTTS